MARSGTELLAFLRAARTSGGDEDGLVSLGPLPRRELRPLAEELCDS